MTYVDPSLLIEDDEVPLPDAEDEELLPPVQEPLSDDWESFVATLTERCWAFVLAFSGVELFPYQEEFGKRIIQSVISGDGATITGELSRQSGKTETVANVAASLMILLPRLAAMFPEFEPLQKFKPGCPDRVLCPGGGSGRHPVRADRGSPDQ